MQRLDWKVVRTAASAGLIVVVPAALLAQLLTDDGAATGWSLLFSFFVLVGWMIAGFGAGRLRTDTPMMHGAAAAVSIYVVIQVLGLIINLASGDEINPLTYPGMALLAATMGVFGALFADWYRRRAPGFGR